MKITNIVQEEAALFAKVNNPYPMKNVTIRDILNLCYSNPQIKDRTSKARAIRAVDSNQYKEYKKYLPCCTLSCTFKKGAARGINNVDVTNHTIVLDIDHITEMGKTVEEVKQLIFERYPSVYWIQTSLSGEGVFALVYISSEVDRVKVYNWFARDLKSIGIELDKLDDVSRLRILAHDPNPLYRVDVLECINEYEEPTPVKTFERPLSAYTTCRFNGNWDNDRVRLAIWKCLNGGFNCCNVQYPYKYWYYCGCDFAAFADGHDMWLKLCDNYGKQTVDIEKQWQNCLKHASIINDDLKRKWIGMAKRY